MIEVEHEHLQLARELARVNVPFAHMGTLENLAVFLDMHRFRSANDWDGKFNDDGKTRA